jgi:DNA-binding MarR family transcriptional regulator
MKDSPLTLLAQLMRTLGSVESRLESALEPVGLSVAKFRALAQLVGVEEGLPLSTLAERCACVRSNITQLVDRLEAEGLVQRAVDPHDRRSVRAELTPLGRSRHAAGARALEAEEKALLARLKKPQRESLLAALELLRSEQ